MRMKIVFHQINIRKGLFSGGVTDAKNFIGNETISGW